MTIGRIDPYKCLRLAVEVENARGKFGKASSIVYRWSEKEGRDTRQIWRWLSIGRALMSVKSQ